MNFLEAFWGGVASLAGPKHLPLVLPFMALVRLAAPQSAPALALWVGVFCAGFAVGIAGLDFAGLAAGRLGGWIVLAAGLGLAAFGLRASGAFGPRPAPPWPLAAILGFCLAFGATPFRGPVLQASDTLGVGIYAAGSCGAALVLAILTQSVLRNRPADTVCGVGLMLVGGLIAMGAYAGLGFWLIEWLPVAAGLG